MRERRQQLEMLNYVPALVYLMGGVSPQVEFSKRAELLNGFQSRVHDSITQRLYTDDHARSEAKKRLDAVKARKSELAHLLHVTSDAFSLAEWVQGR